MTDAETFFRTAEIVVGGGVLGGLITIIYRMGQMTQRFEMVGTQQAAEITDLKMETEKLAVAIQSLQIVLIKLAEVDGRIGRVEDRQLQEGKRVDDLALRFNNYINGTRPRRDAT
jgi:hypothetical protein